MENCIEKFGFKRIKRVPVETRAAIVFTLSTLLCKGINVITTPIFTRILTTAEMGIVTTYTSWYSLISVIANLSLDSGSFNIAMMENKEDRYGYMSSALTLSTISSIIIIIMFCGFRRLWTKLFGLDNILLLLMAISFIFLPATNFWMLHQRYEYKYKSVAIVSLLSTGMSVLISALFTILASKYSNLNLADVRLVSCYMILILWGIFMYVYILVKGKKIYYKDYWIFIFKVNTPLLIHTMGKHILDVSDRVMISYLVGKSEVGVYGILYSISALALIVWSAINAALVPYMFENFEQGKEKKVAGFVEMMLIIYAFACICLTLVAPEVVKILATSEYYESIYLMPPIAAGIFFTSLYNIYSNVLLYYKKTKHIMISTLVASILNVVLNYVFIKNFGYQAAAYTTLVSYIVLAFMQFMAIYKIQTNVEMFNNRKIWGIALGTCMICILMNVTYLFPKIRYTMILIVLLLAFIFHKKIFAVLLNVIKPGR